MLEIRNRLIILALLVEVHAGGLKFILHLLAAIKKTSCLNSPLFPTTYAKWVKAFRDTARLEQFPVLGNPALYPLKRGGMPHESLHGARSLLSARKRGRWASDSSHRRYERDGRINKQIARLSPSQQTKAQLAERSIGGILSGTLLPR